MIKYISFGICAIILIICSAFDIKKKLIPIAPVIIGIISGVALIFIKDATGRFDGILGLLLGAGLVFMAWASRQAIGYGDGLVMCACGLLIGFKYSFVQLCIALGFSAMASLILVIVKKWKKQYTLPFVPFLLAGFVVMAFVGVLYER